MFKRLRTRTSPATVIASVALFFSLGGVGVAATGYRITSLWQISPKVRHALRGHAGARGITGPQGPAGPQGTPGPTGAQGPSGTIDWSHTYSVTSHEADLAGGDPQATVTASCQTGDHAISGGFQGIGEIVSTTTLTAGSDGWSVTAHLDPAASNGFVEAWVYCSS